MRQHSILQNDSAKHGHVAEVSFPSPALVSDPVLKGPVSSPAYDAFFFLVDMHAIRFRVG